MKTLRQSSDSASSSFLADVRRMSWAITQSHSVMRRAGMYLGGTRMRFIWALMMLLLLAALPAPAQKDKKKSAKPPTQPMIACVDEQSGDFVLVNDDMLK